MPVQPLLVSLEVLVLRFHDVALDRGGSHGGGRGRDGRCRGLVGVAASIRGFHLLSTSTQSCVVLPLLVFKLVILFRLGQGADEVGTGGVGVADRLRRASEAAARETHIAQGGENLRRSRETGERRNRPVVVLAEKFSAAAGPAPSAPWVPGRGVHGGRPKRGGDRAGGETRGSYERLGRRRPHVRRPSARCTLSVLRW